MSRSKRSAMTVSFFAVALLSGGSAVHGQDAQGSPGSGPAVFVATNAADRNEVIAFI
jgi:hypothetical protein